MKVTQQDLDNIDPDGANERQNAQLKVIAADLLEVIAKCWRFPGAQISQAEVKETLIRFGMTDAKGKFLDVDSYTAIEQALEEGGRRQEADGRKK